MKKIALSFSLLLASTFFVANASEPGAGCPTCTGTECNGICVPVYGADNKISYYLCADPAGSTAPKDCKRNPGGGE